MNDSLPGQFAAPDRSGRNNKNARKQEAQPERRLFRKSRYLVMPTA
jgi:hypothetical protein